MRRALIVWCACFIACAIAAFHRGFDAPIRLEVREHPNTAMGLDWSAPRVIEVFSGGPDRPYGGADLASYLIAGKHVLRAGRFDASYVRFWPPGMPVTIAGVIAASGEARYPFKMVLLSVIFWSLAFTAVILLSAPRPRTALITAGVLCFLLFPQLRDWTFGFGSLAAESYSHAFFLAAMAMVFATIKCERVAFAIAAAVLFGLAAYYRAVFELTGLIVFAALLLAAIVSRKRSLRIAAIAAVLSFNAVLLPWRLYKHHWFQTASWYSAGDEYVYGTLWFREEQLSWYMHAGNPACHVEPVRCAELHARAVPPSGDEYKRESLRALAEHPLEWTAFKLKQATWLWFDRGPKTLAGDPLALIEGSALLLFGAAGVALLVRRAIRTRETSAIGALVAVSAIFAAHAGMFLFLHFEWRYSQPLRTLCFFLPWWALGIERVRLPVELAGDRHQVDADAHQV